MQSLREKWAGGATTFGGWLSIPSIVTAETAGRVGFDYVCVDSQHGAIDYANVLALVQALSLGESSAVVRVPWNEPGIIGKVLDAGAEGVIVPMVNSRAEAEAVVRACRYAPVGSRSFGPTVAGMRRKSYVSWAVDNVAVVPMIETVEALGNLDEILTTPGLDAIYVGPADLSLSLGLPPGNNDGAAAFDDALAAIVAACGRAGVVPGIHASGPLAERRMEQGFRMITVGTDLVALRAALADDLATAKGATPKGSDGAIY